MKKNSESNKSIMDFEIEFFEKLIKENPDFVDVLIPLAEAYTKAGNYGKGLVVDKRLSELRPDDAIVHYNLACSFSLMTNINEAMEALKKAVNFGYDDFDYMSIDQDLLNVRNDSSYKEIFIRWTKRKRG
ncbi:MAG: tetratricopeptide repeat protein [Candidatus Omnitrophica bacterium]|nr:tetratricopeptide repeat protein [Candidatus Omnitrophota bacterium]